MPGEIFSVATNARLYGRFFYVTHQVEQTCNREGSTSIIVSYATAIICVLGLQEWLKKGHEMSYRSREETINLMNRVQLPEFLSNQRLKINTM